MLSANRILERLKAAHSRGERLVLVFDYDGTLTPLVAHPRLAHLDPALRDVLARLAATPRVTVGVVSGRSLDDVMTMVGLPELCYGGSTGLELAMGGERHLPSEALERRALLDGLSVAFEGKRNAYPGMWVERKPFGFTVHYRQLAEERMASLQADALDLLSPHAAALHILEGPLAIEIAPAVGLDKGTALRSIAACGTEPATVLYAGDSANDAPALAAAADLGGIALGVGPKPPAEAIERVPEPAALGALLAALADALPFASAIVPAHRRRPSLS